MKKRIVTFSKVFPSTHPKKGEPTHFIEAILTQLGVDYTNHNYLLDLIKWNPGVAEIFLNKFQQNLSENILAKSHTIRDNKVPFEVGQFIDAQVWAGKPYNKTPEGYWKIKFAPNFEVKKIWEVEILGSIMIVDKQTKLDHIALNPLNEKCKFLAKNDGLTAIELIQWFNKDFSGQIISWNSEIYY